MLLSVSVSEFIQKYSSFVGSLLGMVLLCFVGASRLVVSYALFVSNSRFSEAVPLQAVDIPK